jgi:hypothetical protein
MDIHSQLERQSVSDNQDKKAQLEDYGPQAGPSQVNPIYEGLSPNVIPITQSHAGTGPTPTQNPNPVTLSIDHDNNPTHTPVAPQKNTKSLEGSSTIPKNPISVDSPPSLKRKTPIDEEILNHKKPKIEEPPKHTSPISLEHHLVEPLQITPQLSKSHGYSSEEVSSKISLPKSGEGSKKPPQAP